MLCIYRFLQNNLFSIGLNLAQPIKHLYKLNSVLKFTLFYIPCCQHICKCILLVQPLIKTNIHTDSSHLLTNQINSINSLPNHLLNFINFTESVKLGKLDTLLKCRFYLISHLLKWKRSVSGKNRQPIGWSSTGSF